MPINIPGTVIFSGAGASGCPAEGDYTSWTLLFSLTLHPTSNTYDDVYITIDEVNNKVYLADPTSNMSLAILDINTQTINEIPSGPYVFTDNIFNLGGSYPSFITGGTSISSMRGKYYCSLEIPANQGSSPPTLLVFSNGTTIFSAQLPASFAPNNLNSPFNVPAIISPTGKYIVVAGAYGFGRYLTVAVYRAVGTDKTCGGGGGGLSEGNYTSWILTYNQIIDPVDTPQIPNVVQMSIDENTGFIYIVDNQRFSQLGQRRLIIMKVDGTSINLNAADADRFYPSLPDTPRLVRTILGKYELVQNGSGSAQANIFVLSSGTILQNINMDNDFRMGGGFKLCAISPLGKYIVIAGPDATNNFRMRVAVWTGQP